MDSDKLHIRHVILFAFHRRLSASAAADEICDVYGKESTSKRTIERWFKKFQSGDTSLADDPREGRPTTFDENELLQLVECNPRQSTRDLSAHFDCSHTTILEHLKRLGKSARYGQWVPHELTPANRMNREAACASLLSRFNKEDFLERIVTSDEKWVLYVNHRRKRQWLTPGETAIPEAKGDLHPKKVMLCIWWDSKGIIYKELLDFNLTITAETYIRQPRNLNSALQSLRPALFNRKGVLLLHDNARPHTAKSTQQAIHEFGWEVLPHPPYSPDIAPSDYHLFRSLQNHLGEKRYANLDEVKTDLDAFFKSKSRDFYASGIKQLPQRWAMVVDSNGDYIID
jgi:histone-lysine N-methyltransferase SETMAR